MIRLGLRANEVHVCAACGEKTPILYGPMNLCHACFEMSDDGHDVLNEIERQIFIRENEIADLKTIIQLTGDLKTRLQQYNKGIRTHGFTG